jgi:hypothetical protein
MLSFNQLHSAFCKQEDSLTDDEAETVRALIENQTISPAFVERLVREHGCGAKGQETPPFRRYPYDQEHGLMLLGKHLWLFHGKPSDARKKF